jgi:hypothetical protein
VSSFLERKVTAMPRKTVRQTADTGTVVEAYGNTWTDCHPATAPQVRALVAEFGAALPVDLVSLFETVAAGRAAKNYFKTVQTRSEVSLGRVLHFEPHGRSMGAVETLQMLRKVHGLAKGLVPFAMDTGNANYFCVDVANGSVHYWLHDERAKGTNKLRLVAPSLADFLVGLEESPF